MEVGTGRDVDALFFDASPGEANNVEMSIAGAVVTIRDTGAVLVAGLGCVQIDAHEAQCTPVAVPEFFVVQFVLADRDDSATILGGQAYVFGDDGNDQLAACPQCAGSLDGGAGSDVLVGNARRLNGGPGIDHITGGDGRNWVLGGRGDDVIAGEGGTDLLEPGPGDDTVDGGQGRDEASFSGTSAGVNVDLRAGQASGEGLDALAGVEDVSGTDFADVLAGDAGVNRLDGAGGGDVLRGRRGADFLDGGSGGGHDQLWGGLGSDGLYGRAGDDLLVGGLGHDRLKGEAGDDRFGARDGMRDVVRGGEGADRGRIDRRLDAVESIEALL